MLTKKNKENIIKKYKIHSKDTGSSEVQAAILTEEIKQLSSHLKKHPKDNHSRRGLLKMVAKRKKALDYLKKNEPRKHKSLIKKLGMKK